MGCTPRRWLQHDGSPRSHSPGPKADTKLSTSRDLRGNWHPNGLNGHPWKIFHGRNAALPPKEFPQRGSVMSVQTVETTGVALPTEREQSPVSIDKMFTEQTGDVKERTPAAQSASLRLHPGFLSQDRYGSDIGVSETGVTAKQVGDVEMAPSHERSAEQKLNSAAEKSEVSVAVGMLTVYLVVTHAFA